MSAEAWKEERGNGDGLGGLHEWAKVTCDWTSIHGLTWYNRIDNYFIKICCVFLAIAAVIGLPTFLTTQVINFAYNEAILTSGEN